MSTEDTVLCPDCGWTGPESALDASGTEVACPVCAEVIEFVD